MADDPLAGQNTQPTASADPLAGWQPGPVSAADTSPPPPPQKGILETSYPRGQPSATNKPDLFARDTDVQNIRGAFGEGYSSVPPSVSREGLRSLFTPEYQRQSGPALNWVGDVLGTGVADVAGVGNSIYTLGNQALSSVLPPSLVRDINVEGSRRVGEPRPPGMNPYDAPKVAELMRPPAPSLPDVLQRQRAAPSTDPVTTAAITLLRNGTPTAPPPPVPFTMTPGPQPAPASGSGLLNIPPPPGPPLPGTGFARAPAPTMTAMPAADIRTIAEGYYGPADKAAAQGVVLPTPAADNIRGDLTKWLPDDPEKAGYVGDNALTRLGKTAQANLGQPMSVDTAMALDRQMTQEKQIAYGANNKTLAGQIGDAQDAIREKMFANPEMSSVPQAQQAYTQYVKQSQVEDLNYRASLLGDDKQGPYIKSQLTSMLRGKQMASWSPEERAAAEQIVQSGNIGALKNFGISLIKPFGQSVGGYVGSQFGPGGTYVGALAGGELVTPFQAKLRAALQKISTDRLSQQITAGVPPPVTSAPPPVTSAPLSTQPGGINIPRAPTPSGSPAIFSYRNGVPYDAQGNPIAPTPQWQATARRTGLGQ